jgi:hypothetical protein
MKLCSFILFICFCSKGFAQDQPKPVYKVILETTKGNRFKGILIGINDTSLLSFPGNWSELKRKKKYRSVQFNYANIKQLHLKRKGRVRRGMTTGGTAGGLLALKLNSGKKNNQNVSYSTAIAITGGTIAGGVVAAKFNDRIFINGNKDLFLHFSKSIGPVSIKNK